MGWFKKKSDPLTERSKALSEQIARLEEQIRELSTQQEDRPLPKPAPPEPEPEPAALDEPEEPAPAPDEALVAAAPAAGTPRLRSTALPHGHPLPPSAAEAREPAFEDYQRNPFKSRTDRPAGEERALGVRGTDFASVWRRFRNNFRGPATSNPKLVSYLAAGSIQGLRPLRYEKRVARNRFILLLICLVLILWGIIAIVVNR